MNFNVIFWNSWFFTTFMFNNFAYHETKHPVLHFWSWNRSGHYKILIFFEKFWKISNVQLSIKSVSKIFLNIFEYQ